jgi:hypothetical protein
MYFLILFNDELIPFQKKKKKLPLLLAPGHLPVKDTLLQSNDPLLPDGNLMILNHHKLKNLIIIIFQR